MSGLGQVVRSGVRRRRLTTVAVGLAVLMAVTAAVLGGALLVASSAPFDRAFGRQHGAHLTVQFDAARLSPARAAGTARTAGVTAAAGPFPVVAAAPGGDSPRVPAPLTLAGRSGPGGPVDDVEVTDGRWPASPGEIVLSADAPYAKLGAALRFPALPGAPVFTVVGHAVSVSRTADAWVTPAALTAPTGYQMLYRFAAADHDVEVAADRSRLAAATPAGALAGVRSWLVVKHDADQNTGVFVPFLAAFGILGLVMSVLVVGTVVAAAVGASIRRIGVLKALGCTPGQVTRAYAGQALLPAVAGGVLGVLAGNALAVPVLAQTNSVYGTPSSGVAPGTDLLVLAGILVVVAGTAVACAGRAGRLRTVDALAVGRRPASGSGPLAARIAARLPGPPPLALGLARPFARPARACALLAAVAFGTVTVTFALGVAATTADVAAAKNHDNADVVVPTDLRFLGRGQQPGAATGPAQAAGTPAGQQPGAPVQPTESAGTPAGQPPSTAVQPTESAGTPAGQQPGTAGRPPAGTPARIAAAITAQPGTRAYYTLAETSVAIAGMSGAANLYAVSGDASRAGYQMVAGRWFRGGGEAVAVAAFLRESGARIGDTVTLQAAGRAIPVRVVGEVFDPHLTPEVLVDAATIPDLPPDSYHIAVRPGTDTSAYLAGLRAALRPYGVPALPVSGTGRSGTLLALNALTGLLTLMLVTIAGLGVLDTVALDTRDRGHDIGVGKALGMTPGQTVAMVLSSVVPGGLAGGLLGVPAGYLLHERIAPVMARAAGLHLPARAVHVLHWPQLAALVVAGVLIALLGAALPAGWAARTRTVTALRTE